MASLVQAQAKRKYVSNAITRYLRSFEGEPRTRAQIFRESGEKADRAKDWLEVRVLNRLLTLGVFERKEGKLRGRHPEVLYVLKDKAKLEKIVRDPVTLTGVIWPSSAVAESGPRLETDEDDGEAEAEEPATPEKVTAPPPPLPPTQIEATPTKSTSLLGEIHEQITAILEVLAKPLVDNIIFLRDKVLGLEKKLTEIQETMNAVLESLTKP